METIWAHYNKLLGYILWIDREGVDTPQQVFISKDRKVELPSGKKYKVTLRNLKLYLMELKEQDPTIRSVQIDRLSRVGRVSWPKEGKVK
jgi:predicted DNA-binding antitoxin AbrB/MazE fold protein